MSPQPAPADLHFPLIEWFARHGRELPWRAPSTGPWAILVCEVMSQQTPVARVAPAWTAWMERWPTPTDLASASPAEVIVAWDRLGYPRRALRLQECARAIAENHGGEVPSDRAALLALPGVGPYTADAVLAFAFGKRSVVLDTNIRRVLARWHGSALPAPSQTRAEEARADSFVPDDDALAASWNAAIMEFGALICTARSPKCEDCPMQHACERFQGGRPEDEHAATRRTQPWHGTHRQARGLVMGRLRKGPTTGAQLASSTSLTEARLTEAISSLLDDGLIESLPVSKPAATPDATGPSAVGNHLATTYRLPE